MSFIFDLHSHFSFKPANSANFSSGVLPDPDHWRERIKQRGDYSKFTSFLDKTAVKSSQLNGNASTIGGFRVICNSLYPLERGFMAGPLLREVATLTGFSCATVKALKNKKISYFFCLEREYKNLIRHQNKKYSIHGNVYKVISSYSDILKTLKKDPDTICILNSVEGLHSFADDRFDNSGRYINMLAAENKFKKSLKERDGKSPFEEYIRALHKNIDKVKSKWTHTPFFVGVSHHYYNHIAGHSPSLGGLNQIVPQNGGTLDDTAPGPELPVISYYGLGIQKWGYSLIQQLLNRYNMKGNSCRRILIDCKHMSPQARLDYYNTIDIYSQHINDRIPIVYSHTGVSARPSLKVGIEKNFRQTKKEKNASKYFYNGIINLFDDEIKRIINSDGMIGLMIDERRIMGSELPVEAGSQYRGKKKFKNFKKIVRENKKRANKINTLKHDYAWGEYNNDASFDYQKELGILKNKYDQSADRIRSCYLSILFRQIFHLIEKSDRGKDAWDHISLGTDYDGVINPVDIYLTSDEMQYLFYDLVDFWKAQLKSKNLTVKTLYSKYKYNRKVEYWINKLLWLNGLNFLKKYFTDEYLRDGKTPARGWVLSASEEKKLMP